MNCSNAACKLNKCNRTTRDTKNALTRPHGVAGDEFGLCKCGPDEAEGQDCATSSRWKTGLHGAGATFRRSGGATRRTAGRRTLGRRGFRAVVVRRDGSLWYVTTRSVSRDVDAVRSGGGARARKLEAELR